MRRPAPLRRPPSALPPPSPSPSPCPGAPPPCTAARFAGNLNQAGGCDNCAALGSSFFNPTAIAVDANGTTYISDGWHRVVRIGASGLVQGAVGCWVSAACSGFVNGVGTAARFNSPGGLFADAASGILYIADTNNHAIRGVHTALFATAPTFLVAGNGTPGAVDGVAVNAVFPARNGTLQLPGGVVANASGAVFVADTGNHLVRVVVGGAVRTLAGAFAAGWADGVGTAAALNAPWASRWPPVPRCARFLFQSGAATAFARCSWTPSA